ncbi:NAD(P)-binding protein [Nonomuraea harbinensis]|uniref:NAD(P)-binding protein n=1 Tax=Nonomuraea harbinensis TaxID=1286938 RepID=A0ABW1BY88_9ACTN|nr:NAD(P)-binding protein [Nonomuraea harbinensis]
MTKKIVVVGGGLAGLVAAVVCAEAGAEVTLHEAHRTLGGRRRAIAGPYLVHEGAHVFYADGPHWAWLRERGLVAGLGRPAVRDYRMGFVRDGRMRLLPPVGFLRMMATGPRTAPVEMDFHTWASRSYGERTARVAANAISVVTYDADTGRLSAAFVWDLLRRVFAPRPPAVRHAEVACILGRSPAAVRQLVHRAREHVEARRPRFPEERAAAQAVAERFLDAALGGSIAGLMEVLAPDVTLRTDGGGRVKAALRPVTGSDRVSRLLAAVAPVGLETTVYWSAQDGPPTAALFSDGLPYAVLVVVMAEDRHRISEVYGILNPDKLARLAL